MLEYLYGRFVSARRRRFERHPEMRRRTTRPVVSVGNLRVGGSRKSPVTATVARALVAMGERPSILSRGYGRRRPDEGVVVVSDGARVRADLGRAGDEPLMLARQLPGVRVLVSPDRFLAARLAECHLGATVHVLDDGFQHVGLERDVDLLLVSPEDLEDRLLPLGRLGLRGAAPGGPGALIVTDAAAAEATAIADHLGVATAFALQIEREAPRAVWPWGVQAGVDPGARVVAFAGIARPARFFEGLRAQGLVVADVLPFRDHHEYEPSDLEHLREVLARTGASVALTTEKDATRLLPLRPLSLPVAWVPLAVTVQPAAAFETWLSEHIGRARERRSTSDPYNGARVDSPALASEPADRR